MVVIYFTYEDGYVKINACVCNYVQLYELFILLDENHRDSLSSDWWLGGIFTPLIDIYKDFNVWEVVRLLCKYEKKITQHQEMEEEVIKILDYMQCDQSEIDELYDMYSESEDSL